MVSLTFDDAETASRADAELATLAPKRQLCGTELNCYFSDASSMVPEIVRRLDSASVPLVGLSLSRPSLDDVFLRATGERLLQATGSEGASPR